MYNLPPNFIPDSRDALSLNGIVGYDVNAFIYDRPSVLPISNPATGLQNDEFQNQEKAANKKSGWHTFGAVFLSALGLGAAAIFLKKKFPDMFKNLGENVQKIFKKS